MGEIKIRTEEYYMENLRKSLYEAMERNGWTQAMAAIQCDMSRNGIFYILSRRDKTDIKLSTIVKIANRLDMPISKLLGEDLEINRKAEQAIWDICRIAKSHIGEGRA